MSQNHRWSWKRRSKVDSNSRVASAKHVCVCVHANIGIPRTKACSLVQSPFTCAGVPPLLVAAPGPCLWRQQAPWALSSFFTNRDNKLWLLTYMPNCSHTSGSSNDNFQKCYWKWVLSIN